MKTLILLLALVLTPCLASAQATVVKDAKLHSAEYHGHYRDDAGTLWHELVQVTQHMDGSFHVLANRRCSPNFEYCTNGISYGCVADSAGPEVIPLVNKNKMVLDLKPGDCDYVYPDGTTGTQLTWLANGDWETSYEYTIEDRRLEGPDNVQCMEHSDGGRQDIRSASVEGILEDSAVDYPDSRLALRTTSNYVQNCSQ